MEQNYHQKCHCEVDVNFNGILGLSIVDHLVIIGPSIDSTLWIKKTAQYFVTVKSWADSTNYIKAVWCNTLTKFTSRAREKFSEMRFSFPSYNFTGSFGSLRFFFVADSSFDFPLSLQYLHFSIFTSFVAVFLSIDFLIFHFRFLTLHILKDFHSLTTFSFTFEFF